MLIAGVAQLVEQRIRNAQVGGSSPFTSSIDFGLNSVFEPFFFAFFTFPLNLTEAASNTYGSFSPNAVNQA